jgi:hypothetical protein
MAFKDLVKQQRQGGGGLISSVGSAAAGSARESLDIRNTLFKSGSLLNTLFPNVKGFKAGEKVTKDKLSSTESSLSATKLDQIGENTKIAAKNSFVLPAMARDMNVMRQNIVKLVKLQGGNASTKADMFFMKSSEREAAYENQLAATKQSASPSKVSEGTEKSGIKSFLMKLLGGLLLMLGVGIAAYFMDPDFKKKINTAIENFKDDLLDSFKSFSSDVLGPLSVAFVAVTATMWLLKRAMVALLSALGAAALTRMGLPPRTPPGSPGKTGSGAPPGSPGKTGPGAPPSGSPGKTGTSAPPSGSPGKTGKSGKRGSPPNKGKNRAGRRAGSGRQPPVTSSPKPTPVSAESKWTRFVSYVQRVAGPLYAKIGTRLLAMAGLATIPIIGWVGAAISFGLNAYLAWELYTLWRDFNAQEGDEIGVDTEAAPPTSPQAAGQSDGLELLNRVMDSEGITDPGTRERIIKLAQKESSLNPNAMGPVIDDPKSMHRGDRGHGLLQIMPKTAPETGFSAEEIKDPEIAALAGVRYFMQNMKRFNNDLDASTVAHHAGPGGARRWLETGSAGTTDRATGLKTDQYLADVRGASTVASASGSSSTPAMPARSNGSTLNSGSVQVADGRMAMGSGQSVIVNAPQTNVQQGSSNSGNSGNIPSVVDTDFMRHLVAQMAV